VDDELAGDPMNEQQWVRLSLTYLAKTLRKQGYCIGRTTIRRLLRKFKYGLFGNRKSLTPRHPDRERQFRFIRRIRKLRSFKAMLNYIRGTTTSRVSPFQSPTSAPFAQF